MLVNAPCPSQVRKENAGRLSANAEKVTFTLRAALTSYLKLNVMSFIFLSQCQSHVKQLTQTTTAAAQERHPAMSLLNLCRV